MIIVERPKLEVEKILAQFINNKRQEYFVNWKDRLEEENSWERKETLWKYEDKICKFGNHNLWELMQVLVGCYQDNNNFGGGGCKASTDT